MLGAESAEMMHFELTDTRSDDTQPPPLAPHVDFDRERLMIALPAEEMHHIGVHNVSPWLELA